MNCPNFERGCIVGESEAGLSQRKTVWSPLASLNRIIVQFKHRGKEPTDPHPGWSGPSKRRLVWRNKSRLTMRMSSTPQKGTELKTAKEMSTKDESNQWVLNKMFWKLKVSIFFFHVCVQRHAQYLFPAFLSSQRGLLTSCRLSQQTEQNGHESNRTHELTVRRENLKLRQEVRWMSHWLLICTLNMINVNQRLFIG